MDNQKEQGLKILNSMSYDLDKLTLIGPNLLLEIEDHDGYVDGIFMAEMEGKKKVYGKILQVGINEISGEPYSKFYKVGETVVFNPSALQMEAGFFPYYRISISSVVGKLSD